MEGPDDLFDMAIVTLRGEDKSLLLHIPTPQLQGRKIFRNMHFDD